MSLCLAMGGARLRRAVEKLELRMRFSACGKGFGVTSAAKAEFQRQILSAPLKRVLHPDTPTQDLLHAPSTHANRKIANGSSA